LIPGGTAGGVARAKDILLIPDFRRLLGTRMMSQVADGIFQATLLMTVVFLPERQGTVPAFALATALFLLPFSFLGPFAGVFVDRWRRRRILVATPLIRAAVSLVTLPGIAAALVYLGALAVFSVNRFFLATASAVLPRVLGMREVRDGDPPDAPEADGVDPPSEHVLLFDANAIAAIGGSVALFAGLFVGSRLSAVVGVPLTLGAACLAWSTAAFIGSRLSDSYAPQWPVAAPLRKDLAAVLAELLDGLRRIRDAPTAIAPILTVAVGQFLQIVVIIVCLVMAKAAPGNAVLSFSWFVAAAGIGVFAGFLTAGWVHAREDRLIGLAFVLSAAALIPSIVLFRGFILAFSALFLGLAYAWTRVPADTLAQRAVPDRYRGRVFAVMDLGFNTARVLGAVVAIPVIPLLGPRMTLAAVAVLFLLWAPVTPLWLGRAGKEGGLVER
jgi:MFS family permease